MSVEMEKISRLAQEHGNDLAFVINHSGGKDSTRTLGLVRKKFPYSPAYAVMADTGFEHKVPISAADCARLRCAEFGLDLSVVRNLSQTSAAIELLFLIEASCCSGGWLYKPIG